MADAKDPVNDPVNDPRKQSTASGVTSAASLGRGFGDAKDRSDPDKFPDQRPVVVDDEPVDVEDDDAVARALHDGRRDLIDVSQMSLQRRMQFGLLTPEDDEKRVRGELGSHVATHDGVAKRTNVGDTMAGSENKDRNAK